MRVHVEGDTFITGDNMGFSLATKSISKSGKNIGSEIYSPFSHHPTVSSCITKLLKMKIAESTATTLRELIDDVARIEKDLLSKISF